MQKARALYDQDMMALDWGSYDSDCRALGGIAISGLGDAAECWQSDDLRLRLAAGDLFDALEGLVAGDRAEAAECGFSDDGMTWLDDVRRALARAKGAQPKAA